LHRVFFSPDRAMTAFPLGVAVVSYRHHWNCRISKEGYAVTDRPPLSACPICDSRRIYYAFSRQEYRLVRCADCTLLMMNPQPSDAELDAIYSRDYFLGEDTPEARARVADMKRMTARYQLRQLARYRGGQTGTLLEIGCGQGDFLVEAKHDGYAVTGLEISPSATTLANQRLGQDQVLCGTLEQTSLEEGAFDVCVLSDVIEHTRDPRSFLNRVHGLLKPNGVVFLATPSLDSWSARFLRQNWMEFKPEHLTYFDTKTLPNLLYRCGFGELIVQPGRKALNLGYVAAHFERFSVPFFTTLVHWMARLAPRRVLEANIHVVASGMAVFARSTTLPIARKLSVIVPAYNEADTLEPLMDSLLRKQLRDLDIEVVLVESNSTDGTREIAVRYQDHPRVQVVLEERPLGKGHAVRTGLERATGDFVLIQDADLEYDLDDYDALLEPLLEGRESFVLGSRHGGSAWKMRHFADQRWMSLGLNFGHWFFTALVNILFGQRLRDPFTMFKVFRRDCLFGLRFECNRFDFDYELLIKLIRKGYRPIEIPVNYRSRSFREGKKVSVWRDPLLWLRALVKLRLTAIDPMAEIERLHKVRQDAAMAASAFVAAGEKR
jgi:glycosyltransferase involved in cell wall biosynthesis/2-polyprenyl-3-methyl-5-hydroxy-6-metoxy-1,4-benzoquinol methylase